MQLIKIKKISGNEIMCMLYLLVFLIFAYYYLGI